MKRTWNYKAVIALYALLFLLYVVAWTPTTIMALWLYGGYFATVAIVPFVVGWIAIGFVALLNILKIRHGKGTNA